jgi:hypothetical protein
MSQTTVYRAVLKPIEKAISATTATATAILGMVLSSWGGLWPRANGGQARR